MIDINMCLPWFEESDCWCALCSVASCFTVQDGRIIQKTFDFKIEGLVEEVWRHLCELVYDCDVVREMRLGVCFVNVGERDASTIAVFIPFSRGGLHIERSWTRNATRNLCHVWDSSTLFE